MVPADSAIATNIANLEAIGIDERGNLVGHLAWGRRVAGGRSLLIEGFVRTLVIELITEGIELALLCGQAARGRPGGFGFEGTVHALMASVLLGLAGLDELREDAKTNPPCRERRETGERVGGEGNAVVSADPDGEAEFLEEAGEDRFSAKNSRGMECLAAEQETTVAIGDGEGVAVNPVTGFELALEISAPDIVGA